MGYTKKWTPPTIPYRDDLTAWKTLFNDLHDNLITAGLVQTSTSGQLDINAVSSLPADNTFAGFREYVFDDSLQSTAPIVIKLEFGCGYEGFGVASGNFSWRTRTPTIQCTVNFKGNTVYAFKCPQASSLPSTSSPVTTQNSSQGTSYLSHDKDKGWLGYCYGAGSRNKPFAASAGNYYGATLTLFVQRTLDTDGIPTSLGIGVYHPFIDNGQSTAEIWSGGLLGLSCSAFSNGSGGVVRRDMSPRIGRDGFAGSVDAILLEPIYYPSNPPQPFPFIASYRNTMIAAGTEFEFNSVIGEPLNFVAIGNETNMSIDSIDGQRAGIAMLFE